MKVRCQLKRVPEFKKVWKKVTCLALKLLVEVDDTLTKAIDNIRRKYYIIFFIQPKKKKKLI